MLSWKSTTLKNKHQKQNKRYAWWYHEINFCHLSFVQMGHYITISFYREVLSSPRTIEKFLYRYPQSLWGFIRGGIEFDEFCTPYRIFEVSNENLTICKGESTILSLTSLSSNGLQLKWTSASSKGLQQQLFCKI